ncbi:MAG: protein translocase subunit SecD [Alphaproteobacteria bacterium]|nr:protein translocase subunit SecD [Alphaproteobacteria bacterium]
MLYIAQWKIALILLVCFLGFAFNVPNLLSVPDAERLPRWLPHQQLSLGLDLQGGSQILLEVDTDAVIRDRMEALVDATRNVLRQRGIGYLNLGIEGATVVFKLRDASQADSVRELLRKEDTQLQTRLGEAGTITVFLTEQELRERRRAAVEQSLEIVRRRIDETGMREPVIQRQGQSRIVVQLPGVGDPQRIKRLLGKTAKLNFHMVEVGATPEQAAGGRGPAGTVVMPSDERRSSGPAQYVVRKRPMLAGERLVDARPSFQDGAPVVNFRFDTLGAKQFGKATQDNVGKLMAIALDDRIISAPVIREPILGGSGIISGSFTTQEAQDLALLLRAGALPAPLNVLEERTVGPGLGADSIHAGKIACIAGVALIIIFMVMTYGLFGVFSCVGLLVNLVLTMAVMSLLQATLTLPGIAGLVLSVGVTIDSNVLIFERMREELRAGRSVVSAMDTGYHRAMTTIIDSNLTQLIASLALYAFGTGPIKGFAVTLSIGIAISMFTAITLTRVMIVAWLRRTRPTALPI